MKRHYFIGKFDLGLAEVKCLDTEIIHQINDVLKMKIKEEVVLCDGKGNAAIAEISIIGKNEILFFVKMPLSKLIETNKVILYSALLKRDSFEWLLQKAVETGVDEIVPLLTERTIKSDLNIKRSEKIAKEAAEQSERQYLPNLHQTQSLKEALKGAKGNIVFFDPIGETLGKAKFSGKEFSIFIGPEGGWSEKEIELARNSEATILNLGNSILRGETAATVAVYLAKNIF